jgi:hypothetical protein
MADGQQTIWIRKAMLAILLRGFRNFDTQLRVVD